MKHLFRILAVTVTLMLSLNAAAQQQSRWYLGGGIVGGFNFNNGAIGFVPEIGYRISPNISAGLDIGYIYQKSSGYRAHRAIVDPYIRAHYTLADFIYVMAEAFARYDYAHVIPDNGDPYNSNYFRAGLRPGIGMRVGSRSYLIARIGYLGYKSGSGEEGDGQIKYHCTSNDVFIGYGYNF